ncbi:hypothetical protein IRJ41_017408, partial [Triplophysa rosa]
PVARLIGPNRAIDSTAQGGRDVCAAERPGWRELILSSGPITTAQREPIKSKAPVDANQQCCQSEVQSKKFIFSSQPFTFQTFLECVPKKFDLPTINVKVFDDSKTEVDEEAFEYLLTQPNLGVLKMIIPGTASLDGWDSDMSSILMLVHLLPPSSQGRKRPGKISARQACDRLVKFIKTSTSIQGRLDSIGESLQTAYTCCWAEQK